MNRLCVFGFLHSCAADEVLSIAAIKSLHLHQLPFVGNLIYYKCVKIHTGRQVGNIKLLCVAEVCHP